MDSVVFADVRAGLGETWIRPGSAKSGEVPKLHPGVFMSPAFSTRQARRGWCGARVRHSTEKQGRSDPGLRSISGAAVGQFFGK